jgi:O-antigen/teichoic acid export membrane protein
VNVALNFYLVPTLSIDGAAWATVGTEVIVTAGCAIALRLSFPRQAGAVLPLAS